MDDMLVWLILSFAHKKLGSKLEVYAQLPLGNVEEQMTMRHFGNRLAKHCTRVYRDPSSVNVDPIVCYWEAEESTFQVAETNLLGDVPVLDFNITTEIVVALLEKDKANLPPSFQIFRVDLIKKDPIVFFTVSSL